ncbi:MAG: hypothetical protein Q8Q09_22525 [Deltaproteobacteria bacterium]|nr:hypothetical protein [Deltaproteobacteria bacterium]
MVLGRRALWCDRRVVLGGLLALASATGSCRGRETSIVLVIDSDFELGAELARVEIETSYQGTNSPIALSATNTVQLAGRRGVHCVDGAEAARFCGPFSLALVPSPTRSPGTAARVVVRGYGPGAGIGDPALVERKATLRFVEGQRLGYPIFLERSCRVGLVSCTADETCVEGRCVSAEVPTSALTPVRPMEELNTLARDGGMDAGTDGALRDGGAIAPCFGPSCIAEQRLFVGRHAACVIRGAERSLWCWGGNQRGLLGRGISGETMPNSDRPARVVLPAAAGDPSGFLQGVRTVTIGATAMCAVTVSNLLYCWGDNRGQTIADSLASGEFESRPFLVRMPLLLDNELLVELANNWFGVFLRTSRGRVFSWGSRFAYSLGDADSAAPPVVTRPTVNASLTDVGVLGLQMYGEGVGIALMRDQTLRVWGVQRINRLGLLVGTRASGGTVGEMAVPLPTTLPGLAGAVDATISTIGGCARLSNQTLQCWGGNEYHLVDRLQPIAETAATPRPRDDLSERIVHFVRGSENVLVLTTSAKLLCFGARYNGVCVGNEQLPPEDVTATVVPRGRSIAELRMGDATVCVRLDNDSVRCWGNNDFALAGAPSSMTEVSVEMPQELGFSM